MVDNNFGKSFRLLSANDFLFLRKGSKRAKDNWLMAYYKSKPSQERTRLGLSVSKKVGNAVVRNRVKRILREAFRRSEWREMGVDALFVVSPYLFKKIEDKKLAEAELLSCFNRTLKKIGTHCAE